MNRKIFNQCIVDNNFKELFIGEMGWNNPKGQQEFDVLIDEQSFTFSNIAERNGFQIFSCAVPEIPSASLCKKIDAKLRRNANDYICIYLIPNTSHHLWAVPVKKVEKRDITLVEYLDANAADFLFEKINNFSFSLDENTTILDVVGKVHSAFIVNSEKITKDFYTGFKKEHTKFATFISGIDDHISEKENRNKQWYTSVMLNRLMFCYFIQKKGFLNNDVDYLRHKLENHLNNKESKSFFNTFYKDFLVALFYDGLNAPKHNRDFELKFGRIPYLNGGMFDFHQIEQDYKDLDIADAAFEGLFDFFDKWHWHLDDRITASGRDINPDVLGYIFEQYINDRAQMGAYYTKEDITEYIGRNTIVPFLVDDTLKTDPSLADDLWQFLQNSGDRYIFDAVKKGNGLRIPHEIAEGIDTNKPNLLERRKLWNTRTPEEFALPTEIWRETIERLQRYNNIKTKIGNGELRNINDFITYNLDIRTFVFDYLDNTQKPQFIEYFYNALQNITILDPTCGSGAFLFATLNILEPLYEVCLMRMQEFHDNNKSLFAKQLDEVQDKYRSNIRYFIYKSIILRNLYGVDIMVEATEIAKLRLFLKMVAVVDVDRRDANLGLDPLPDIDFNIRCGNTLVGYATEKELNNEYMSGGFFAAENNRETIMKQMDEVADKYRKFKELQLIQTEEPDAFKRMKKSLGEHLTKLNDVFNKMLYDSIAEEEGMSYEHWLHSHQPFHWLAEFYEIITAQGGFDVVIGNPPYVEYNKEKFDYKIGSYKTGNCGNLYAFCIERSILISQDKGRMSLIVPMSLIATNRMKEARLQLSNNSEFLSYYNLAGDWHPGKLFEGVRSMFTIFITENRNGHQNKNIHTTDYTRWSTDERSILFTARLHYYRANCIEDEITLPKIGGELECSIIKKVNNEKTIGSLFLGSKGHLYYRNAGLAYYQISINFEQKFYINGIKEKSSTLKELHCEEQDIADMLVCLLNSNLFSLFFYIFSDCYHLTIKDIYRFKYTLDNPSNYSILCKKLMNSINKNCMFKTTYYRSKGEVAYQEFYPRKSKPIIDEIDKVLAEHYGFTEEELDFIINYDIKYRMGEEL